MKKKEAIKDRDSKEPTLYYPSEETSKIPGVGEFPITLVEMSDGDNEDWMQNIFQLSAVTIDFIYYAD